MMEIFLYTTPSLRAETKRLEDMLASFAQEYRYHLHAVDISNSPFLMQVYQGKLPSLEIGVFKLGSNVSLAELEYALSETQLNEQQTAQNKTNLHKANANVKFTAWDNLALWFTQHYLQVIIGLLILIVGLAFLAPVLMERGRLPQPKTSMLSIVPFVIN